MTMTGGRRGLVDGRGRAYPLRALAARLADTIVRTLLVVAALYVVAGAWELLR